MGYRQLLIRNKAHIHIKDNNVAIRQGGESVSVPSEELSAVVLESRKSTITTAALDHLGAVCPVYICDERHLPSAMLHGFHRHSRQLSRLRLQLSISKPLQKQLWKRIVQQKIHNQAAVLDLHPQADDVDLTSMVERVRSGDTENIEGQAAWRYFVALFGVDFTRTKECTTNAALNYGYAIVRGAITRYLVAVGLQPSVGIHHHSQLNAFNLADDIIEPFRPYVDKLVVSNQNYYESLHPQYKNELIELLSTRVHIGEKQYQLQHAIEITVDSLVRSFAENDPDQLQVPSLC